MTNRYLLSLPDNMVVEVVSIRTLDEKKATDCAMDALVWLQSAPLLSPGKHPLYSLTCLLCQATNAETSFLVQMQEHLIECHGFTPQDHQEAIRVCCVDDESLYIWTLSPERATALALPRLSYMQAVRPLAKEVRLNALGDDLDVYLSAALRVGTHFDTISGVLRATADQWYPVMICGKEIQDQFQAHRMVLLTDEPMSQKEAALLAWRSHSLFHQAKMQEEASFG